MIRKLHVSTTMVVPALVVTKTTVPALFLQEVHSHPTGSVKGRFKTYQIGLYYLNSHLTKLLTYFSGSIQTKRATSSATVSYNQPDIPIDRNAIGQSRLHEPPRPPAPKMQKVNTWICGICQKFHKSLQMIRCGTCETWFHKTCVYTSKNPKHMLFSTPTGLKDSWFICSKCLDQQNDYVSDAIAEYVNTMERLKRRISSREDRWHEPCIQVDFSSQTTEDQQEILPQEDEYLGLTGLTGTDFELAREERFQGFDKSEVDGLIQDLISLYMITTKK
jgi:PHD-finger